MSIVEKKLQLPALEKANIEDGNSDDIVPDLTEGIRRSKTDVSFHARRSVRQTIRGEREEIMDKILFGDDSSAESYLKSLISSQGLQGAWQKLVSRLKRLEEATGMGKARDIMTHEELEGAFATRKECLQIVAEEYEHRLQKQDSRLKTIEDALEATWKRFGDDEKEIHEDHNEITRLWKTLTEAKQEITRVETQDNEHYQEALNLHARVTRKLEDTEASFQENCNEIRTRQEDEAAQRAELNGGLQRLNDFLYSKGLQTQLQKICADMLDQYVSWDGMKEERAAIHAQAVDAVSGPILKEIEDLRQSFASKVEELRAHDESADEEIANITDRFAKGDQKLLDRIDDVVQQVNQRALDSKLTEVEKRLTTRDEYNEQDFSEFKEVQTKKIEESFDRMQELEASIFAHEHALEHWAEEIANRSTKYDLMVCSARIDNCAIKDKVDAELQALHKTVSWQSVKMEKLTFNRDFKDDIAPSSSPAPGSKRATIKERSHSPAPHSVRTSRSPRPVARDSVQQSNRSRSSSPGLENSAAASEKPASGGSGKATPVSPTPPPPPPPPIRHEHTPIQGDTEYFYTLQQQLEKLAQCVLNLETCMLRPPVCGLSREAHQHEGERLIHHTCSLLQWIMHRAAPPEWDSLELTTMALKCLECHTEEKMDRRRRRMSLACGRRRASSAGDEETLVAHVPQRRRTLGAVHSIHSLSPTRASLSMDSLGSTMVPEETIAQSLEMERSEMSSCSFSAMGAREVSPTRTGTPRVVQASNAQSASKRGAKFGSSSLATSKRFLVKNKGITEACDSSSNVKSQELTFSLESNPVGRLNSARGVQASPASVGIPGRASSAAERGRQNNRNGGRATPEGTLPTLSASR